MFIFGMIRAIGMILLGFEIVQVGFSLKSHHPSQRANGFLTFAGGIFITILSFVMILTVYGRFLKLYMYTAISPLPLSASAGEMTQNISVTFIKSYASICLEGAIILLACIIYSAFASTPLPAQSVCYGLM